MNPTGTRVYVFLKPIWQGRVEGLCGNYDGDSVSEYKKVDGSEGTAMDFANSWAASTSCPVASVGTSSEIVPCSVSLLQFMQLTYHNLKNDCRILFNVRLYFYFQPFYD